jgi:hypothetical protein
MMNNQQINLAVSNPVTDLIILVSDSSIYSVSIHKFIPVNSFLLLSYPEKAYKKIRVLSFAIA